MPGGIQQNIHEWNSMSGNIYESAFSCRHLFRFHKFMCLITLLNCFISMNENISIVRRAGYYSVIQHFKLLLLLEFIFIFINDSMKCIQNFLLCIRSLRSLKFGNNDQFCRHWNLLLCC